MDSVPRIVKSMVPSGIKNELRKIQDKSYSKISASDVFTIGKNLLLTIPMDIDFFLIKKGKKKFKIPFSANGTRYNLEIDKITQYAITSGMYQLKAQKNGSTYSVEISENEAPLSGMADDISYQLQIVKSQVYLEILNSKDSNSYLLNKKVDILAPTEVTIAFANENFIGINLKKDIKFKEIFFENGFGKKINISFWKNNNDFILGLKSVNQNPVLFTGSFYLMGITEEDGSAKQTVFKVERRNQNIILSSKQELDHVLINKLDIYQKYIEFEHIEKEIDPWPLLKKIKVDKNQIFFDLDLDKLILVKNIIFVVKKTGEIHEVDANVSGNQLIVNGHSLSDLPSGYVIDMYVGDSEGQKHRLIDRGQKKYADIYRHFLLKETDSTKTYAYYTKTGRISFFKSISPIELVKAKTKAAYFEMHYDNGKLSFESDKSYEAILKTNNVTIEPLGVSYNNGINIIDLSNHKFMQRHNYQILLKEKGNHNYNYVIADVLNKDGNLTFIDRELTFVPASSLKLSIIVTFYNTQKYLDRLFSSLLRQGLAPTEYEVLAINDCSTDNSREIAEKYANKYPQFRVIDHELNKGLGEGRNTGVKAAKAKYITFIDGDDFIRDNAYKEMLDIITRTGSQLITGGVKRFRNNRIEISWMYRKVFVKSIEKTTLAKNPELVYDLTAWNKIYNRQWFVDNKFEYPTMLYEDVPVTLPALNKANSIDIYADDMYYWFVRDQKGDESITNSRTDINNFSDRMSAIRSGVSALQDNDVAKFEYEQKALSMDIPMYLRHFNHVTDEYREELSKELNWVLNNFMPSAIQTLSDREIQRMELVANGDFENLFSLYEEGELAE